MHGGLPIHRDNCLRYWWPIAKGTEPHRVCRRSKTTNKYSPEVRKRAVRLVLGNTGQHESRWAAIVSVSGKIGSAAQTLNEWVKKADPTFRSDRTKRDAELCPEIERVSVANFKVYGVRQVWLQMRL